MGLNYQSVILLFDLYEVEDRAATFEALQVMEFSALKVMNAKEG